MPEENINGTVPSGADGLASALASLVGALVKNHKDGGGLAVELSKDVGEALKDLSLIVASLPGVGSELSSAPIGVAEAFVIAGFKVARDLSGK